MKLEKLHEHRDLVSTALTLIGFLLLIGLILCGTSITMIGSIGCGFALITVLGLRDVLWQASQPDERQQQLRDVAQKINFSFLDQAEHNPLQFSDSFLLTRDGIKNAQAIEGMVITRWLAFALPKFRNLFQRTMGDMTVTVFDYEFSENDESPVIRQTVFALRADDLDCPHMALCPATTWDKFASKVSSSVQLERGYRLTADDDSHLEMTDDLIELLDGVTYIEVGEGHLLLYRRGLLIAPAQIELFIKEGLLAYSAVVDSLQQSIREELSVI